LEGGPPIFRKDCSCPALLEDDRPGFPYGAVTRCGPPFQTLPVPKPIATGLVRFRSPLLAESRLMSVPPATEMFQFAGFASRTYEFSAGYPGSSPGWVAPFGDPGINDRSHLPRAFRSVPRPSSPLSAKASTRCPSFALDPKRGPRPGVAAGNDTRFPENRRAQGQTPKPIAPLVWNGSPASGTPTRPSHEDTSPDRQTRGQDHTGQDPRPRRSASVTFANPLYPSINPGPAAAAARPADPRPLQAMARPARPAAAPEPNFIFSERRLLPGQRQRLVPCWWR
jgi:hypothetical protein